MTGTGIGFDFSQLMTQFAQLDAELKKLTSSGKTFGDSMKAVFAGMTKGDFKNFASQIKQLRGDVVAFGKVKVGLNWDSTSLQNYINDVNRLILVIKQVREGAKGSHELKGTGISIQGLKKELKDAQELLAIVKKVEQQTKRSTYDRNTSYAGATNYSNNAVSIEQNAKAVEYLTAARNKLKTTDADYLTKLEDLNTRIQKHNEILHRSKQTNKEVADEAKKTAEATKRANDQMLRTPSQLVGMKGSAKTMNELRLYAEQLRNTMNTLNPKSAEWQKLNGILKQTEGQIYRVENKMKGINVVSGTLKNALSGVGRMFATAFAVERLWQYSKAIVSVTGEFEQMQVALKTIIGNTEDANRIWDQTMELARNSPFQARELIKYTRQLAAYRIETEKLHDTTRMLADVSAGLGVDMSRLILAYGQVRAAEYLRGTELRQFTEAGVPMLEELASHFSELEGRAVSTAEAFDMISKRQVAFSDVEAVLEKMTSEGGPFYKMQEVMSNTVKGSISNLKDEVDLMMYEIGQDNSGMIKGFINLLRTLVKNWRYVAAAIKTVTVALVSYTVTTKLSSAASSLAALHVTSISRAMVVARTAIRTATASVKGFLAALGPIGWATVIISTLVTAFTSFSSAAEESDTEAARRAEELEQELEQIDRAYNEIAKTIDKNKSAFDKAIDTNNMSEAKLQLNRLIELAKDEYSMIINVQLDGATEEDIKKVYDEVYEKLSKTGLFAKKFQKEFENNMPADDSVFSQQEDLLDHFVDKYAWMQGQVEDMSKFPHLKKFADSFRVFAPGEDPIRYMEEFYTAFAKVQEEVNPGGTPNPSQSSILQLAAIKNYELDVEGVLNSIKNSMAGWEFEPEYLSAALTGLLKRVEIPPEAIGFWKTKMQEVFGVENIGVIQKSTFLPWEESFNEELENLRKKTLEDIEKNGLNTKEIGDRLRLSGIVVDAIKEDNKKSRPELAKALKEQRDIQKAILDAVAAGSKAYTEVEAQVAQIKFDQYDAAIKFLEGNQNKNKGKNPLEEANRKRIELLKQMNSQFLNEFKTFGDEAEPEIRAAYEKAFGEVFKKTNIKLPDVKFDTKEGMVEALEALMPYAKKAGKDAVALLEKEIAKFKGEIKIEAKKEQYKKVLDEVQGYFDRYQLTVELKKLNIHADLAKDLLDLDYLNLEGLEQKVKDAFSSPSVLSANTAQIGRNIMDEFAGNVDFYKREMVDAQELVNAGWIKSGEMAGEVAAIAVKGWVATNDRGQKIPIAVNPILPDGTVLTKKEMEDYLKGTIKGASDILAADTKGVIIQAGATQDALVGTVSKFNEMAAAYAKSVASEEKQAQLVAELNKEFMQIDWSIVEGILGPDQAKELKNRLTELNNIELNLIKERMKTYSKYLVEGMTDRVRLKMEEMRKLKEIEESSEFSADQKTAIKNQVTADALAEQDKQEWESFKGTEMYTMMFDDLEFLGTQALATLQDKLEKLKSSLSHLPANELKEIVQQISKIEDATIANGNPFKYMRKSIKGDEGAIATFEKETGTKFKKESEFQADLINAQAAEAEAQRIIDAINLVKNAQLEHGEQQGLLLVQQTDKAAYDEYMRQVEAAKLQGKTLEQVLETQEGIVVSSKQASANAARGINIHQRSKKALQEQANTWSEWENKASEAMSVTKELMSLFGASEMAMSIADSTESMIALIFQAIQFGIQMQIAGYQANMALGVIGWILIAVQAIATILSAIFNAKDAKLQAQIDAHLDKVKELGEEYEDIEEKIDNAWDVASIQEYNAELRSTTQSMMDAQRAAIAARKQKKDYKNGDADAMQEVAEMEKELAEMEKRLAESFEESFSKVTDGIIDEVLDTAKEFTDAWYDAFKETGDGLSGLEENFEEMFMNLAKNQAAMQITGKFVEDWKDALGAYINEDDTELTREEAAAWAEEVKSSFPELNAALEAFLGTISEGLSGESGSLSELQKGIQGITEETAQVLESLLNSMRLYVADTNNEIKSQTTYIKKMWTMMDNAVNGSSPFYVQMKTI